MHTYSLGMNYQRKNCRRHKRHMCRSFRDRTNWTTQLSSNPQRSYTEAAARHSHRTSFQEHMQRRTRQCRCTLSRGPPARRIQHCTYRATVARGRRRMTFRPRRLSMFPACRDTSWRWSHSKSSLHCMRKAPAVQNSRHKRHRCRTARIRRWIGRSECSRRPRRTCTQLHVDAAIRSGQSHRKPQPTHENEK